MQSILFLTEGTSICRVAAEVAIALARRFGAEISAHYVIDPQRIFELAGFDGPGLCGSGVFIQAERDVIEPLTSLGESLLMSFQALAEGHGVRVTPFVDIGNTADELFRCATKADLIIMADTDSNLQVARDLTDRSPCLIMVVQSDSDILVVQPPDVTNERLSKLTSYLRNLNVRVTIRRYVGNACYQTMPAPIPLRDAQAS